MFNIVSGFLSLYAGGSFKPFPLIQVSQCLWSLASLVTLRENSEVVLGVSFLSAMVDYYYELQRRIT